MSRPSIKIEPDGRIHYMDAHPDSSMTHGFYDLRFVRAYPGMGAGFKNWRPVKLVGAQQLADGSFAGGLSWCRAATRTSADFSRRAILRQRRAARRRSRLADGRLHAERTRSLDWYDYVRAKLAGGRLEFDPLREVADMVDSNCADLHDRVDAVAPRDQRRDGRNRPSRIACRTTSTAPMATGRPIPRRRATRG